MFTNSYTNLSKLGEPNRFSKPSGYAVAKINGKDYQAIKRCKNSDPFGIYCTYEQEHSFDKMFTLYLTIFLYFTFTSRIFNIS